MARPQKNRHVKNPPRFRQFKPLGIPSRQLDELILSLDEYEALRLADGERYNQSRAAELMGISRPTFTRLIESARYKMAEFLEKGPLLTIDGGAVHFLKDQWWCRKCGHAFSGELGTHPGQCPQCGSTDLHSLAERYGHGICCRESSNYF